MSKTLPSTVHLSRAEDNRRVPGAAPDICRQSAAVTSVCQTSEGDGDRRSRPFDPPPPPFPSTSENRPVSLFDPVL